MLIRHRTDMVCRTRRRMIAVHRAQRAARQQRKLQEQRARKRGGEAAELIHPGWAELPGRCESTPFPEKVRQVAHRLV